MTVPITNLKISDIVTELGETNTNVTLKNLHRSAKVRGISIDPTYCDGANPYQRLYSIQKFPLIGKFRNYEQLDYSYKMGLLYGGSCVYSWSNGNPTIHIPTGWHILTQNDWFNILQTIEPGTNFTNNVSGHHLLCNYNRTDILNFNEFYFNRTGERLIQTGAFVPIFANGVLKSDTYGFKAIASSFLDIFGANSIGNNWTCWIYDSNIYSGNNTLPLASIRFNINFFNAISVSTVGYSTIHESFNGRFVMTSIRLVKDDSTNPGYVEDIEGNIYPTIKIGNTVIMAEGYRCTKDVNGNPLTAVSSFNPAPNVSTVGYYYANSLMSDMP